ncbi:hypothetical protein FA15DRAFT_612610 [Coprinopsis marcescibilis]|uniref:UDP-N-acetylglucosamine transferase subunit ALG13 n=1 Tax=Coprinopsis marcescibilis TaxID=230819 RepID=A0A5C3L689_COPMA|nr:hypothetical protein FA15DRAFT_612610 [Coprinopsis marcescibilis]
MGWVIDTGKLSSLCIAYYCSGHGYGHATRVSALVQALLNVDLHGTIHIVSSAPEHVFSDCIKRGAFYRYAEIDPVIVQPLAYEIDRQRSLAVLKSFLSKKDLLLQREKRWLQELGATAVLSDAAFLGCMAAKYANIPSALVTNFTFDSVYSFLSAQIAENLENSDAMTSDIPLSATELEPLIDQIHFGYRCADLLVLLPGSIPIPSFFCSPSLPASSWVTANLKQLHPQIIDSILWQRSGADLLPAVPFPDTGTLLPRSVIDAPLLVREPSRDCYTPQGRLRILSKLGLPAESRTRKTRVLVVSFGGQYFQQPSRDGSRNHIRNVCREHPQEVLPLNAGSNVTQKDEPTRHTIMDPCLLATPLSRLVKGPQLWAHVTPPAKGVGSSPQATLTIGLCSKTPVTGPNATYVDMIPHAAEAIPYDPQLLPDESWIAIVCGVSKEKWLEGAALPDRFYVAPKDIYMPDLTAIADVLLGKLGYGTVSECVDACTPFIYVSRPLFVEEYGLKIQLEREGVGVELERSSYEAGDWAPAIREALKRGKQLKERKRLQMAKTLSDSSVDTRHLEIMKLAEDVIGWVDNWANKVRRGE